MTRLRGKERAAALLAVIAAASAGSVFRTVQGAGEPPGRETSALARTAEAGGAVDARGNWIVRAYPGGQPLALVRIGAGPGAPRAELLALGTPGPFDLAKSRVEALRIDDEAIRFDLRLGTPGPAVPTYPVVAYRREVEGRAGVLRGSIEISGSRWPAELERTEASGLEPKAAGTPGPGVEELERSNRAEGAAKRVILEGILEKHAGLPIAYIAAYALMYQLAGDDVPDDEVRSAADRSVRLAAPYGPELRLNAAHFAAWRITAVKGRPGLAVRYARQAESLLRPSDPPALRASVLKTLAAALRKAGRVEEAGAVSGRFAGLEEALDRAYLESVPALETGPPAVPRGRSGRPVLVEAFTGARCAPCVAADTAFAALGRTYPPDDLVLLEYHVNIPGFDALANEGGAARAGYYGARYAPFVCVDGEDMGLIALPARTARAGYEAMRKRIDGRMAGEPGAALELKAERQGDKVTIRVRASRRKKAGDAVRVRLVIAEEEVRYEGGNGVRLHRHVARAFPAGVEGFALGTGPAERTVVADLSEVAAGLSRYLDGFADERRYPDNCIPDGFGRLSVIALVQDDATKEVLVSAEVAVP